MSNNRIRVPGYSQRIFYNNNIEYRPYSSNLVGLQDTSIEGATFTMGNFNVTTNVENRLTKFFNTKKFSNFYNLEDIGIDISDIDKFLNRKKLSLKLDKSKIEHYAYFGSFKEFLRVSLENIIIKWPAGVTVSNIDFNDPITTNYSYFNGVYDLLTNISTISINKSLLINKYGVKFTADNFINPNFIDENELRDFTKTFSMFEVTQNDLKYTILNFIDFGTYFTLYLEGNVLNDLNVNSSFIIKPNDVEIEKFFTQISEFERHLLNRDVEPKYTATFDVELINEFGVTIESERGVTWPVTDGYNIEFDSEEYLEYVNAIIEIADISDSINSDIMARFLVSNSLLEFDTVPVIINENEIKDGQKINTLLKVYGRSFDEVKKYIDGISLAHVVTYDELNNTPDEILKNLATVMGWDVLSSPNNINFLKDLFHTTENSFEGSNKGMSQIEMEYELWRRLILNTPWLWKSKGTRKGIEFITKFLGIPDGLLIFNEHIYSVESKMDVSNINLILDSMSGETPSISDLNIDLDGYPYIRPNTEEMYFQKAGLWYRETGGQNSNLDIHTGNNPHVGGYDGGQEFVNQFKNLIPNFSPVIIVENTINEVIHNIFTNNDEGDFNIIPDTPHVEVSNTDGLNLDDYLIVNNYISIKVPETDNINECGCSDNSDDGALTIEISASQPVNECKFTGFTLGDDGIVIFTYDTGDTDSVTAECCKKLGFTPEIGPKKYNICRWKEIKDTCENYTPLKPDNNQWYFTDINGVITTEVPLPECCPVGSIPKLQANGYYICGVMTEINVCDDYIYTGFEVSSDALFNGPNGQTTIVPTSDCCTRFGLYPTQTSNGWVCGVCRPHNGGRPQFNELGYVIFTAPDGSTFTEVNSASCCPSKTQPELLVDPNDPEKMLVACRKPGTSGGSGGSGACRYLNSITAQPNLCSGGVPGGSNPCEGVGLTSISVSFTYCDGISTGSYTWNGAEPSTLHAFNVNACIIENSISINPPAGQRVQINWGTQSCPPQNAATKRPAIISNPAPGALPPNICSYQMSSPIQISSVNPLYPLEGDLVYGANGQLFDGQSKWYRASMSTTNSEQNSFFIRIGSAGQKGKILDISQC